MQFGDSKLDHAFDPLKVVDIKTLAAVADNLKKSKDKSKRAIGVFLDRINRIRTEEPSASTNSDTRGPASRPSKRSSAQTTDYSSTGLRDLRD